MPYITTFEILDEAIKKTSGKPTVLEALWDGDTQGWFLELYLYTESGMPPFVRTERHFLGMAGVPEGMDRITNDRWTEAELADQFGNKAAEKYNLTFYFPSKDNANDDCPAWTERHLGIECDDCGKLIIPTNSPYLPKDICYHCHLKRERDEKLKDAKPYNDGINLYLSKDDECLPVLSSSRFELFPIAPFIDEKVKSQLTKNQISIVELSSEDIIELKIALENVLGEKLSKYEKPVVEEARRKFYSFQILEYKGKEYELAQRFNSEHIDIADLISSVETADKALAGGYTYKFFFKNGFTYRDDSVLRSVRYDTNLSGYGVITGMYTQYAHTLTESEVLETLKKMEQLGCVTIDNDEVRITELGRHIL